MKGRDLPFPLLHDATSHTLNAYLLGDRPRFMLLDPKGVVVRGGSPELLQELLEQARKQKARARQLLVRLRAEKNPRKAALLVAEIASEGGEGAALALLDYGAEVKDRAAHLAVLEGLGRIGWSGASAFLCGERGLGGRDPALRLAAAKALRGCAAPCAVPTLLEIVRAKAPEPALVGAACEALVRLAPSDGETRAAIEALCASRNAGCRGHGLEALVGLGCPGAPERLRAALEGDENAPVRLKAAQLLARVGCKEAIAPLRKAAEEDRSPAVRKAAEAALKALETDP